MDNRHTVPGQDAWADGSFWRRTTGCLQTGSYQVTPAQFLLTPLADDFASGWGSAPVAARRAL
jgi:hypothetical protein